MAQTYANLAGTDTLTASRTTLNNTTDALRSSFSGGTAPGSPVQGQLFYDTSPTNQVSVYNGSGWILLFDDISVAHGGLVSRDGAVAMTGNLAMGTNKLTGLAAGSVAGDSVRWEQVNARTRHCISQIGTVSASQENFLIVAAEAITITRVSVVSATATSGSGGSDKWTFTAQDLTSPATLATANTDSDGELVANTPYSLGTISSGSLTANDVLELQIVKTGTPGGSITQLAAIVEYTIDT